VISVVLGKFGGLPKLTLQPGIVLSHLPSCSYELPEPEDCGLSCARGCEGCVMVVWLKGKGLPKGVPLV
jgi:hypothetical protein